MQQLAISVIDWRRKNIQALEELKSVEDKHLSCSKTLVSAIEKELINSVEDKGYFCCLSWHWTQAQSYDFCVKIYFGCPKFPMYMKNINGTWLLGESKSKSRHKLSENDLRFIACAQSIVDKLNGKE